MGPIVLYTPAKIGKILRALLEGRPKRYGRTDKMTDGRNDGQTGVNLYDQPPKSVSPMSYIYNGPHLLKLITAILFRQKKFWSKKYFGKSF